MCGIFAYLSHRTLSQNDVENLRMMSNKIQHRGPDVSRTQVLYDNTCFITFHRLRIVDLSEAGMQPMNNGRYTSICNGEIYNFGKLRENYQINTKSECDCEIIPHLLDKVGIYKLCEELDGVFAMTVINKITGEVFVARDPFGVRSLYYGVNKTGDIIISSEMKSIPSSYQVKPFPPGNFAKIQKQQDQWKIQDIIPYYHYNYSNLVSENLSQQDICQNIRGKLETAVEKRLMSERPIGCLLSGGLDSSIIASLLVNKFGNKKLKTFSIGLPGSEDLKYAELMAKYLGTEHHSVELSQDDMFKAIRDDIYHIESYDTTTIRASTPMYLLCKYIKKNTDVTVIFSGEGSDEASGSYMYFHNAPDDTSFKNETVRLLKDLHRFDVLRCDKSSAAAGLEIRVPFLDKSFIEYYMNIDPSLKRPVGKIEKYLLRESFSDILPKEIKDRQKEGMSDGVSSMKKSWASIIQDRVENYITEREVTEFKKLPNPPLFKESMYYRKIFHSIFGRRDDIIPYYWMPKWSGDLIDPSARILNVYDSSFDNQEQEQERKGEQEQETLEGKQETQEGKQEQETQEQETHDLDKKQDVDDDELENSESSDEDNNHQVDNSNSDKELSRINQLDC